MKSQLLKHLRKPITRAEIYQSLLKTRNHWTFVISMARWTYTVKETIWENRHIMDFNAFKSNLLLIEHCLDSLNANLSCFVFCIWKWLLSNLTWIGIQVNHIQYTLQKLSLGPISHGFVHSTCNISKRNVALDSRSVFGTSTCAYGCHCPSNWL